MPFSLLIGSFHWLPDASFVSVERLRIFALPCCADSLFPVPWCVGTSLLDMHLVFSPTAVLQYALD